MTRRPSPETLLVLEVMVRDADVDHYGREIRLETGLGAGTVYPILHLLERRGWASSTWEDIDPTTAGRPRRRLYRVTDLGLASAGRGDQPAQDSPAAPRHR